jgi:hypothetical protein
MDVRLDDFGYNSDFYLWVKIVKKLREKGVKRIIIAIIPFDNYFGSKRETLNFLKAINDLNSFDVEWSLHGYYHNVSRLQNLDYLSPIARKGEFIGDSTDLFVEKIANGLSYLNSLGLVINSFSPPNHYVSISMLDAINDNFYPQISKVYHGVGHFHCQYKNLEIITWRSPKMNNYRSNCVGFVCLHPETMTARDLELIDTKEFICTKKHKKILFNTFMYNFISKYYFMRFNAKFIFFRIIISLFNGKQ